MKKVLVATGTSENKKKYAVTTIETYLTGQGITEVEVTAENVYEMDLATLNPDIIVLIGPRSFDTNIPVIDGRAFITKIDAMVKSTCEEIRVVLSA